MNNTIMKNIFSVNDDLKSISETEKNIMSRFHSWLVSIQWCYVAYSAEGLYKIDEKNLIICFYILIIVSIFKSSENNMPALTEWLINCTI